MDAPLCHPYGRGRLGQPEGEPLRPGGSALTRQLIEQARFGAGQRILDLGCGCGDGTALLGEYGCRPCGLDADFDALALARQRHPGLDWVLADGGALPLASGSLDGVLAECSLSLMADRDRTLAECRRLLRPGGKLALGDVCRRGAEPDAAAALPDCLGRMTTPDALHAALARAGFAVEWRADRSEVIKTFAARLIFASGSLSALWSPSLDAARAADYTTALRAARPGYFLFLARAE
jgi:arsenite methyltransferase